ncbi:formyltetrahydrofolate deformylase [Paeniglutamicibacter sp. MACA_103]|uniref:formyltetrahydrofolate deformylase n=1 Tax=Paeniglutamicibacter sp. MACA_103 TaxID=3377337 RepID=UPI003893F642
MTTMIHEPAATADATHPRSVRFVLTLSCPDKPGIVRAVTGFLDDRGFDIAEHQQFDDHVGGRLFLRTALAGGDPLDTAEDLEAAFGKLAGEFDMDFAFHDGRAQRVLVMVSKFGHCLNDLIYRWRTGTLGAELVGVVSNHEDLRPMAEAAGLTFIHVPVTADTKPAAEARLQEVIADLRADVVVLARYMQVLSNELTRALHGRAINIHHSFLPGFKGAKPYHQAYARGVKMVGATAHYVTESLDEGPIIEQEVFRVDHVPDADALARIGRDAEAQALARAITWHCQHRILLNNTRTVVFR